MRTPLGTNRPRPRSTRRLPSSRSDPTPARGIAHSHMRRRIGSAIDSSCPSMGFRRSRSPSSSGVNATCPEKAGSTGIRSTSGSTSRRGRSRRPLSPSTEIEISPDSLASAVARTETSSDAPAHAPRVRGRPRRPRRSPLELRGAALAIDHPSPCIERHERAVESQVARGVAGVGGRQPHRVSPAFAERIDARPMRRERREARGIRRADLQPRSVLSRRPGPRRSRSYHRPSAAPSRRSQTDASLESRRRRLRPWQGSTDRASPRIARRSISSASRRRVARSSLASSR